MVSIVLIKFITSVVPCLLFFFFITRFYWLFSFYQTLPASPPIITSDVSRFIPLRIWILSWILIAIVSVLYKNLIYPYFISKYDYLVDNLNTTGGFVDIALKPSSRSLNFNPGQFAFFSFISPLLSSEAHPFSFAGSSDSPNLRICVKNLGDFTSTLPSLKTGDKVVIQGPYGLFGRNFYGQKNVIGIAGGVGITPFLSLLYSSRNNPTTRKFHLFYSARTRDQALDQSQLNQLVSDNFKYYPWFGDEKNSKLTAADIKQIIPDFNDCRFYLCGPKTMMTDIRSQLLRLNIPQRNIFFEDFDLR